MSYMVQFLRSTQVDGRDDLMTIDQTDPLQCQEITLCLTPHSLTILFRPRATLLMSYNPSLKYYKLT